MENTKTYTLTETLKPNGKAFYEVKDSNGMVIGKRLSTRRYVACLVREESPSISYVMQTWFDRLDLVFKGDSRHCQGDPQIKIVYLQK